MPYIWNKIIVVTKDELVPEFYTWGNLSATIARHKDKPGGIKKVQTGGNGRMMLIEFQSLPAHIQLALSAKLLTHFQTLASNHASKNKIY